MGGKSADINQSPYQEELDTLGNELMLSTVTGQPISNSPNLNNFYVAQSMGGDYDVKSNSIKMPDGTAVRYDPLTDSFSSLDKKGNPDGAPNQWVDKANSTLGGMKDSVYGPNSVYNLFGKETFGEKVYDPVTGNMVDAGEKAPQQMTGDYLLSKYGGFLNDKYNPTTYNSVGAYKGKDYEKVPDYTASNYESAPDFQKFDYQSPTIKTVDPINQEITDKLASRASDEVGKGFRSKMDNIDDFVASSGGSLGSGRAARLKNEATDDYNRERSMSVDKVQADAALRSFYDAQTVRDMQAAQDMDVQKSRGVENTTAQAADTAERHYANESNIGEKRKAFDTNADQNKISQDYNKGEREKEYDTGQSENRYKSEFDRDEGQFGYNADVSNRNFAANETQANRQQSNNKIQALQDFLRIYAGEDATAGQLAASNNSLVGGALGGLFGAAGSIAK